MAAPTSAVQKFQKILANAGPSTHGLEPPFLNSAAMEEALGRTQYYATIGATVALSAETKSNTCNRTCSPRWPPLT